MQALRTTRSQHGRWTLLDAVGQLDVVTGPELRQELVALAAEGANDVAVGLDGVEFLDSFGLGVLVGGLKRCRGAGGDLAIVCTRERLLRLFAMTDLDRILTIVADASSLPASRGTAAGH